MKKIMIIGGLALAFATAAPAQEATRWAIKGYDNIGLGKAVHTSGSEGGESTGSNVNSFGLDFGYTFWRHGCNSLEVNLGVGYTIANATFGIPDMKYDYAAPAIADEDGNLYQRYYELTDLRQQTSQEYVNVPVYLEYQCKPLSWLGIYAEAGVNLAFNTKSWTGKTSGSAYAYGIFPEYDDLLINEDYLDDFGHRRLEGASSGSASVKKFGASIMCGAGFEFYTYQPVSFVVGVRYQAGLTDLYAKSAVPALGGPYTAENAPVTYTVKDGTRVNALTGYSGASKLSPLSLHLGINIRF